MLKKNHLYLFANTTEEVNRRFALLQMQPVSVLNQVTVPAEALSANLKNHIEMKLLPTLLK
jgi:hypothetical protein